MKLIRRDAISFNNVTKDLRRISIFKHRQSLEYKNSLMDNDSFNEVKCRDIDKLEIYEFDVEEKNDDKKLTIEKSPNQETQLVRKNTVKGNEEVNFLKRKPSFYRQLKSISKPLTDLSVKNISHHIFNQEDCLSLTLYKDRIEDHKNTDLVIFKWIEINIIFR